jgi:hypothetical protein
MLAAPPVGQGRTHDSAEELRDEPAHGEWVVQKRLRQGHPLNVFELPRKRSVLAEAALLATGGCG